MPEDLNALLNAHLDGRLSAAQRAKVLLRLKQPSVALRLERLRSLRLELRAALPEPRPEQSRRMWAAVRARLPATLEVGAEARLPVQASVPVELGVEAPALPTPAGLPSPGPFAPEAPDAVHAPSTGEPWYSFITRPWTPAWGLGLVGAAAALAWVLLLNPRAAPRGAAVPRDPVPASEAPSPAGLAAGPAQAGPTIASVGRRAAEIQPSPKGDAPVLAVSPASEHASKAAYGMRRALPGPATGAAPASVLAALPAGAAESSSTGVTEVERALADNQVDDMIDQFLTVRQHTVSPVVAEMAPSPEARPGGGGGLGAATVAYQEPTLPVVQDNAAVSGAPVRVQGAKDGNGFWDWNPAALALNQRDWPQARVELQAAAGKAGEAAERAFANSALSLLSAPGAPLEGSQPLLPAVGDLRVLSAGTWQLLVDSRLARFGHGVSVRLPGLRADGDSFLFDLTFDRGEFAAGTHFIRVSGEAPVRVIDAGKQPVSADDFYAPAGADYDLSDRELRLR